MAARVSIIMGIYNCAETLPEAIDSILSQTYPHWKLIMCNDGSTDNTLTIAKQYQAKDPERIIVIENERNMGLNFTLNHCLEYADTEFVARMDGDDISLPQRLEKEVQFLDTHPEYAIVSTPMIYFDENGDFRQGHGGSEPDVRVCPKGTPFCHAPCMVRKEAYDAVSRYAISPARLRVEDWDLWVRMRAKGFRGYRLDEPLYLSLYREILDFYATQQFLMEDGGLNTETVVFGRLLMAKKLRVNPNNRHFKIECHSFCITELANKSVMTKGPGI